MKITPEELKTTLQAFLDSHSPEELRAIMDTPKMRKLAKVDCTGFLVGTVTDQKIAAQLLEQERTERVAAIRSNNPVALAEHKAKWSKVKIPLALAT